MLIDFLHPVKQITPHCVIKVEMSPLTAKLKCPHGTGEDTWISKIWGQVLPFDISHECLY